MEERDGDRDKDGDEDEDEGERWSGGTRRSGHGDDGAKKIGVDASLIWRESSGIGENAGRSGESLFNLSV